MGHAFVDLAPKYKNGPGSYENTLEKLRKQAPSYSL